MLKVFGAVKMLSPIKIGTQYVKVDGAAASARAAIGANDGCEGHDAIRGAQGHSDGAP